MYNCIQLYKEVRTMLELSNSSHLLEQKSYKYVFHFFAQFGTLMTCIKVHKKI